MLRAAEYLRYSSSSQTEQSIEGQQADCDKFADGQNIEVVARYIDRAERGTRDDRIQFQKMMEDAKKNLFDVVLVWKYDRFSRDEYHSLLYENRLNGYGIKLVSVMEPVPEGAVGTATKGMLRVIAQFYTDDLREKVIRGMAKTAEKGNYPGGRLPLGYKAAGGKRERQIVIDPETAPFAKTAFAMYAAGNSKKEIAEQLTLMGARSSSGGAFTIQGLSSMFTNEKYIGVYSYDGKYRQEGAIPALIDMETWNKVQQRAQSNKRHPGTGKAKEEYALSLKLYCGYCGALMAGESGTGKNGTVHRYYKCSTRKRFKTCQKKNVRKDEIEAIVAHQIRAALTDEFIIELAANVVRLSLQTANEGRSPAAIEKELKQQDRKAANLAAAIATAGANPALLAALQAVEEEKQRLNREMEFAKEIRSATSDPAIVLSFLKDFQEGEYNDPDWMKKVFNFFVNRVYLYDDHLKICLNTTPEPVEVKFSDINGLGAPNTTYPNYQSSKYPNTWIFTGFFVICAKIPRR